MSDQKNACVIYVVATENELPAVKAELEQNGYAVCAVLATTETARKLRTDDNGIPEAIKSCIKNSDLCVFLIPDEDEEDGGIHGAAGLANQLGKRIVGLVSGSRTTYPEGFDTAGAMIRISSPRLSSVLQGEDTWEAADKTAIEDRSIHHQKCQ